MIRVNMGRTDRVLRLIVGLALIPVALLAVSGWLAIVVAVVAVVMLATSLTGSCPGYIPLGVSTVSSRKSVDTDPMGGEEVEGRDDREE
jgi:hypothetical protein